LKQFYRLVFKNDFWISFGSRLDKLVGYPKSEITKKKLVANNANASPIEEAKLCNKLIKK
jgi:hypothetical protein